MKSLLRRYCVILALLIYWAPNAPAQNQTRVDKIEIRHVGPAAVSDELIRANIRVKPGDNYNRNSVDEDIRNLYGTGYFYNIRVAEEPTGSGVKLVYVVQGKLILTNIRFDGNKQLSTSKIRKKVSSKTGEPLDEQKLFADSQEIIKLYQKSGYQKTDVKATLTGYNEAAGRSGVTFEITESPKVKIHDIQFTGVSAFPQKKLAKVIKTRKRWMFSWITGSGVLKDDQFEDDKEKLADFYREAGYIDFEIKDIKFDYVTPARMDIVFTLYEGKLYKVGTVTIKGNTLFSTEDIVKGLQEMHDYKRSKAKLGPKGLEMDAGTTFTPKTLSKDIESLQDFYGSRGYVDVRVAAIKTPNTDTGTIDLVYQIEENTKSYIEKIEIRGNTKTKDKVIRRELAVTPGEVFDMVGVKLSKKRLEGLNYFEKVDAQPEPTDVPNRKNLVVGVEEKNTGNFTIGAGFSSVESIVGFAEVTQGNFDLFNPPYFTGGGQKIRLRTQLGSYQQDYQLSFVEPWFLDRKLSLSYDLYYRDLSYLSAIYDEKTLGTKIGLSRALGSDFIIGTVSYTVENNSLALANTPFATNTAGQSVPAVSNEILNQMGGTVESRIGLSLAYDTRNSTQLPDKGQRTEFNTQLAGGPLGGDADYYSMELRTAWYFKGFAEGHVLELNGRVGVIQSFNSRPVPLEDRYYLGGLYSLRGFRYREVGPRDQFNESLGGSTYWYGTAEYSLPIIDRLRFAVFYDVGMVYKDPFSFSARNYPTGGWAYDATPYAPAYNSGAFNDDVGIGFRLNLPIGPLRLDYGIPMHSDPANGGSGRFQFGVGYTREF